MAKVWFIQQQNRLIAVGGKPAYERPFESIQWPLDIGVHRFYTDQAPTLDSNFPTQDVSSANLVLVELQGSDVAAGSSYKVGFYSSPYSPRAAAERLGQPWAEGSTV